MRTQKLSVVQFAYNDRVAATSEAAEEHRQNIEVLVKENTELKRVAMIKNEQIKDVQEKLLLAQERLVLISQQMDMHVKKHKHREEHYIAENEFLDKVRMRLNDEVDRNMAMIRRYESGV